MNKSSPSFLLTGLLLSTASVAQCLYGVGTPGIQGVPTIGTNGVRPTATAFNHQVTLANAKPSSIAILIGDFVSTAPYSLPFFPSTILNTNLGFFGFGGLPIGIFPIYVGWNGQAMHPSGTLLPYLATLPLQGTTYFFQWAVVDPSARDGIATSQGLAVALQPGAAPPAPFAVDAATVTLSHLDGDMLDASGNGNHGTGGGSFTCAVSNHGMAFNGNAMLYTNSSVTLGAACTVELWFRPDQFLPFGSGYSGILLDQSNGGPPGLRITLYPDSIACQINNSTQYIQVWQPFVLGVWHHVAMQWDFAATSPANRLRMFLDGAEVQEGGPVALTSPVWPGQLAIGAAQDNGEPFVGVIDEVRVSNVARY